jgi:mono/diheme cytochrome c family protein
MTKRPSTRRERQAARAAAARRRRLAAWVGVIVVVVAAASVMIAVLAGGDDDGPAASTPPARIARGEELFQNNCATCHGPDLRGTFVGPPLLHEIYAPDQLGDDDIRAAVANGVTPTNWDFSGMPAFPNLDADDVAALTAYIRASQRAAGLAGSPSTTLNSTIG